MKKTVLTISALFLLSAGGVFAADDTMSAVPEEQNSGCACACEKTVQDAGHKHSGHMMHQMHGKQKPAADEKAQPAAQSAPQQHVH